VFGLPVGDAVGEDSGREVVGNENEVGFVFLGRFLFGNFPVTSSPILYEDVQNNILSSMIE
jgi:hypothetical protein